MRKLSSLFLSAFFAAVPLSVGNPYRPASAEPAPSSIPTRSYNVQGRQLLVPDWSRISFSTLPPTQASGVMQVPTSVTSQLGYDPSRIWSVGDTPDKFVQLGDVSDAFHLETFSLDNVSQKSGTSLQKRSMADFGLLSSQTPATLLKADPTLANLRVSQVQPLQDLAARTGAAGYGDPSVAELVQQNPAFASAPLSQLDLKQYSLDSLPGITQVPLQNFQGWEGAVISQVPGLGQVPFSQFPVPIASQPIAIGVTDIVWGSAETGSMGNDYFVSGKVKNGQNSPVACPPQKACPYIELTDILGSQGPLFGKRWVSGKYQSVPGGFGPLAMVNGGKEPTGRLVYGSAFKVVLLDTDESKGTVSFGIFFHFCARAFLIGKTCTPYSFGPVPWIPSAENGLVIVTAVP